MATFNKVILMGNLTRDVELRYLKKTNTPVAKFGLAVNERVKGQDEQWQDRPTFVDITCWHQPETLAKHFSKGKPILIEGRLRLESWKSREGESRSKLIVVCERWNFIPGSREQTSATPPASTPNQPAEISLPQTGAEEDEDDLPF